MVKRAGNSWSLASGNAVFGVSSIKNETGRKAVIHGIPRSLH